MQKLLEKMHALQWQHYKILILVLLFFSKIHFIILVEMQSTSFCCLNSPYVASIEVLFQQAVLTLILKMGESIQSLIFSLRIHLYESVSVMKTKYEILQDVNSQLNQT